MFNRNNGLFQCNSCGCFYFEERKRFTIEKNGNSSYQKKISTDEDIYAVCSSCGEMIKKSDLEGE